MAIKRSKIKNSMSKGTLLVTYNNRVFTVTDVFTKRVGLVSEGGDIFNVSIQEIEFNKFIKD